MKKILIYFLLFSSLSFANKTILVTISPINYFIKQIVKNTIKIETLYSSGKFDFTYRKLELLQLSKTKVYFTIGLKEEEKYKDLLLAYNPKLNIVDLSKNIEILLDDTGTLNPYIWMDPLRVRIIVKNIFEEIVKLDPNNKNFYQKNYNNFLKDIDEIFLKIKKKFYTTSDSIFILKNYWYYYLNRFEVDSYSLENRILKADEIIDFRYNSKLHQTKTLLVEKGFNYVIERSISLGSNTSNIVRNDIYTYDWKKNISTLTNELLDIKEEKTNKYKKKK